MGKLTRKGKDWARWRQHSENLHQISQVNRKFYSPGWLIYHILLYKQHPLGFLAILTLQHCKIMVSINKIKMSSSALSLQKEWLIKYCLSDTIKRNIKLYFFPVMKHMDLHRLSLSTGIPILMQLAASKVSGRGRSSHLGNCSCIKMRGFDLAMLYSCLQRSFSRTSHSSRHSSRGLGVRERSSHRGNTKWQKEGIANCEHWSDKCVEVPIMVNAAAEEQKYRRVLIHSMRKNLIFM